MRTSTSCRNVDMAPCLVLEPTSSLSKRATTFTQASLGAASSRPLSATNAHCRSSSLGVETNSLSKPQTQPCWRLTRKRSLARMSSTAQPRRWATISSKAPRVRLPALMRGHRSTWRLKALPSLTERSKWMHMFGMMSTSSSMCRRRLSMPFGVWTSTRPARPSGLSSQVESMGPPYTSTFRRR